jgi:hypothetical protein
VRAGPRPEVPPRQEVPQDPKDQVQVVTTGIAVETDAWQAASPEIYRNFRTIGLKQMLCCSILIDSILLFAALKDRKRGWRTNAVECKLRFSFLNIEHLLKRGRLLRCKP